MSEIQPLSPSHGVIKPGKIKKDDNLPKKHLPVKKSPSDEQDTQPLKHIDELV